MTAETHFPFSKTRLERLAPPTSSRETYHDTTTPGLTLRVSASGAKSFAWYRKVKGRPVRLTIGSFPATTVEQARRRCQRWAGEVAEGGDPQGQRAADRAEPTLADLWTYWTVAKGQKRSLRGDQYQYDRFLKRWAARKLSAIGKAGPESALTTRVGSLFDPVPGERFDLIIFNAPWVVAPARTRLELAANDEDQSTIRGFVMGSPAHLSPGGRVIVGYADNSGPKAMTRLEESFAAAGLVIEQVYKNRIHTHRAKRQWQSVFAYVLAVSGLQP